MFESPAFGTRNQDLHPLCVLVEVPQILDRHTNNGSVAAGGSLHPPFLWGVCPFRRVKDLKSLVNGSQRGQQRA